MKDNLYILLILGLMLPNMPDVPLFSGAAMDVYKYEIALGGVDDMAEAKEATDYMRRAFNEYPGFNDSLDEFKFWSNTYMSYNEFNELSAENGYTVTKFERSSK